MHANTKKRCSWPAVEIASRREIWQDLLKSPAQVVNPDNATEGILFALALAVEQRDHHTGGHCARLAYVSSFATLPDHSSGFERLQREWIRRLHPYFAVKQRIETDIIEAARTGLPAVIVNPTLCVGPWDIKARELCFIPRLLSGEAPVSVTHTVNVIDVRDVAIGLAAMLDHEHNGQPILLAGHNLSIEALYTWICEIGGTSPPRIVAPIGLGAIATYWSEIALGAIGLSPPLPALAPMLTMLHQPFDPDPLQMTLGIVPRPLSQTLTDAIAWYRQIDYC